MFEKVLNSIQYPFKSGDRMIFISFGRFRKKPTKETTAEVSKLMQGMTKEGIKFVGFYWTLGRYDTVVIMDAPDEKTVMKANIRVGDIVSTETMVAVTREEATKLVE
jgi:uncharacterized protein with GYD domain